MIVFYELYWVAYKHEKSNVIPTNPMRSSCIYMLDPSNIAHWRLTTNRNALGVAHSFTLITKSS